ncbi:MAG: hypothetical protein J0G95_10815 [Rhizobiales bacterium]|nr:hypothetical protein [Hyphomicrobiales bacterium]
MAVAPLNLPGYAAPQTIDWSPLANLGKTIQENRQRQTLADLGQGLADGSIDYRAAAGQLASTGNLNGVVSLLQLGEAKDKLARETAAADQFTKSLGPMFGGQQPAGSMPLSAIGSFGNATAAVESGGKYDALGPVTKTGDRAYGKYQVMGANVGPWTKEVLGNEMSPADFVSNPQAQDAVYNAKFGALAQKYGPEGAARAWFAGEGGMNDPNRRDQLGTTVDQYGKRFTNALAGAGNAPADAQPAAAQIVSPALIPRMLGAMSNPNLPAAQKEIAKTLLTRALDESKMSDSMKGYIYAKGQGYGGTYLEYQKELKKSGATVIDTGTIPAGYRANRDAEGRVISIEPLPGSPEAKKEKAASDKQAAASENKNRYADVVTTDIDRAIKKIDDTGWIDLPVTGLIGEKISKIGGTDSHDLASLLTTVRANIGFDRLQALRDSSPTGGALGQVSDFENRQLQSTLGNLEQSQTAGQLKDNLNRVRNTYLDIIHGPGNGPERRKVGEVKTQQTAPRAAAPRQPPSVGTVQDGYRFKGGNPADPSSWEPIT